MEWNINSSKKRFVYRWERTKVHKQQKSSSAIRNAPSPDSSSQLFLSLLYPNWCWFQYPSETSRITVLSPLFRTRNTMQASMRGERERNVVIRMDLVLIGTICDRLWSDAKHRDLICSLNGSSHRVAESVGSLDHWFVSSIGVSSRWWSEVKVGEGRNEGLPRWSSKPTNFWEEPRAGQGGGLGGGVRDCGCDPPAKWSRLLFEGLISPPGTHTRLPSTRIYILYETAKPLEKM